MPRRADETTLLSHLLIRCSALGARVWRNNCGQMQSKTGQWVRYGIANPGGSDLIGYLPVLIGPEHVGQTLAVFLAIEAKAEHGCVQPEQQHFLDVVKSHGAITCIARSLTDAEQALQPWL